MGAGSSVPGVDKMGPDAQVVRSMEPVQFLAGAGSSVPGVNEIPASMVPTSASSLLEVLRDLQIPAAIPWWPPAPGWWGSIILAVLIYLQWRYSLLTRWFYKPTSSSFSLSANAVVRNEIAELRRRFDETRDVSGLVSSLSVLLRRISLEFFPREEVASLTGESWLEWLDARAQSDVFSSGVGRVLADAPYRKPDHVSATVDGEALLKACEGWIMAITRGGTD